jgi:hypothetical protein
VPNIVEIAAQVDIYDASSATQVMILKNLLERDQRGHLAITDFGRRVLESLIKLNPEN